jgi:hypothetical protein
LEEYAASLVDTPVHADEEPAPTSMDASAEEAEMAGTATAYSASKDSQPIVDLHRDESMGRGQAGATSAATPSTATIDALHSSDLPEVVRTAHKEEHVRQEYKEQLIDMLADFD